MTRFLILGDGAMGTACAHLLLHCPDHAVTLWCRSSEGAKQLHATRENSRFLPGYRLPERLDITADPGAADEVDVLVVAIPMVYLADTLADGKFCSSGRKDIVSVVKGIERETFRTPAEVIAKHLPYQRFAALIGPSHAEEIVRELPASVVAASADEDFARAVQQWFTTDRFRVYRSTDPRGVELSGALKNVMAIAAGICDGLRLGDNAKAALMTRGLVEMVRFGLALGARPETFYGLAGVGDLITTCFSPHGRNRRVGQWLGEGQTLEQILRSTSQVAEGIWTAKGVYDLAQARRIDMPVATEVYRILYEHRRPLDAISALMSRELKAE